MKRRGRIGLILLVLISGSALLWWMLTPPSPKPPPPAIPPPPETRPVPPPPSGKEEVPKPIIGKVAIVIDDMGQNVHALEHLMSIGVPLTFSIIPGLRYSGKIATHAHRADYEIMVHLPMEPENPIHDPGKSAIRLGMTPEEIQRLTRTDLQAIPYAVGVNNHMGSRATQSPETMEAVLEEVRNQKFYFLDSKTTPRSVAYRMAREKGIPAAERQVFLDDVDSTEEIEHQIDLLERIATRRGEAIAIGHPRQRTIQVLSERLPDLERKGYRFVFLSDLVE